MRFVPSLGLEIIDYRRDIYIYITMYAALVYEGNEYNILAFVHVWLFLILFLSLSQAEALQTKRFRLRVHNNTVYSIIN